MGGESEKEKGYSLDTIALDCDNVSILHGNGNAGMPLN